MDMDTFSPTPEQEGSDSRAQRSRANQKRYRDRQKAKREEMESQVAVLTQRMSEMQAAQNSLRERNKSLERFAELAQERERGDVANHPEEGSYLAQFVKDPEENAWKNAFIAAVNEMRGPEGNLLTSEDPLPPIQHIKQESCIKLCRMFGADFQPDELTKKQIIEYIELIRRLRYHLMQFMHLWSRATPPGNILVTRIVSNQVPDCLPHLVATLELTPEQKAKLIAARKQFCESATLIARQREGVLKEIKQCEQMKDEFKSEEQLSSYLSDAAEAQIRLNESLLEEKKSMSEFAYAFKEALTPWQEACLMAKGYQKFGTVVELWDVANVVELEQSSGELQSDISMPGLDSHSSPGSYPLGKNNCCNIIVNAQHREYLSQGE